MADAAKRRTRRRPPERRTYVADRAAHLIAQVARRRRPFFLWANFLAPHHGPPHEVDDPVPGPGPTPIYTPMVESRYRNSMSGRLAPRVPSLDEKNMTDKWGVLRHLKPLPVADLDEAYQQRLESLRSVDDAVMRILRALKATGELRRTLVVFASDNGMLTGQHRWYHKILGYEESVHVPLFLAGPGIAAGVRRRQLVSLTDLGVTLARAGGAKPRIVQDGASLYPLSRDPDALADRSLGFEAAGWPKPDVHRVSTAVRTADGLVLLRWYDGHEEVYDLRKDPFQVRGGVSAGERRWVPQLRRGRRILSDCKGSECTSVRVTRSSSTGSSPDSPTPVGALSGRGAGEVSAAGKPLPRDRPRR